MDTHLWVKEKGRVLGPYTIDKLKKLVDENWLSKMHLVSEDQMTWLDAGDYQNGVLWDRNSSQPIEIEKALQGQSAEESVDRDPSPLKEPNEWWYTKNGQQLGPISLEQLKNMFGCQDLKPDEQVWREGMQYWKAAINVPELEPYCSGGGVDPPISSQLTEEFCRLANNSRGWTMFISIALFVSASVSMIAGFVDLVHAIKTDSNQWLMISLSAIVGGGISVTAGLMILAISNRMANFALERTEGALSVAITSLNRYWLFMAIVIIVSFALGGIAFLIKVIDQV